PRMGPEARSPLWWGDRTDRKWRRRERDSRRRVADGRVVRAGAASPGWRQSRSFVSTWGVQIRHGVAYALCAAATHSPRLRLAHQRRTPRADRPSPASSRLAGSGTSDTGGEEVPGVTTTFAPSEPGVPGTGGLKRPTVTVNWSPPRLSDLVTAPLKELFMS